MRVIGSPGNCGMTQMHVPNNISAVIRASFGSCDDCTVCQFSLNQGGTFTACLIGLGDTLTPCSLTWGGRGYHYMTRAANPPQDFNVTKSYFECSMWILSLMHAASYN